MISSLYANSEEITKRLKRGPILIPYLKINNSFRAVVSHTDTCQTGLPVLSANLSKFHQCQLTSHVNILQKCKRK